MQNSPFVLLLTALVAGCGGGSGTGGVLGVAGALRNAPIMMPIKLDSDIQRPSSNSSLNSNCSPEQARWAARVSNSARASRNAT